MRESSSTRTRAATARSWSCSTAWSSPTLGFARAGGAPIATVWRKVVADLRGDHRVIAPTLPYGSHRRPMSRPPTPDVVNELVVEFLERLDQREVTLVESDCGRAQTVAARYPERLARLVLISCEAFDNYPPGLPGKLIGVACRVPGGVAFLVRVLGLKPLRRLPVGIGSLAKRPVPDEIVDGWLRPLRTDAAIRRDFRHYGTHIRKTELLEAAEGLRSLDKPALVVWATEDLMMPRAHGRRLAELLPQGRLLEIEDSRTLIAEDQPEQLASALREFIAGK